MPKRVQQFLGALVGVAPGSTARARAERHVVQGAQVREQQLALEDEPHLAIPRGEGQEVGAVEDGRPVGGHQTGEGADEGRLPGPVGTDHGHHGAGLGVELDRGPLGNGEVDLQARPHGVPNQRSRRSSSTATETTSITKLSASAASWSLWRVT